MLDGGFKYVLCSSLFGEDEPILTNFCLKMGWLKPPTNLHVIINLQRCKKPVRSGGWNLKAMPLEPKWASPLDQAWNSSSGLRLGPCGGPNKLGRFGRFWCFFWKVWRNGATFFDTIFGEILDGTLFVCFFSLGFKSTFKYYSFNQLQLVWIFEVYCDVCRNVDPHF